MRTSFIPVQSQLGLQLSHATLENLYLVPEVITLGISIQFDHQTVGRDAWDCGCGA